MKTELIVQNGARLYLPAVEGEVTWQTERQGTPGTFKFNVIRDEDLKLEEGNPVRFKVDEKNVFYGFVFSLKSGKEGILQVTAYDQLRYFKNKDTYVYKNKRADEFIKMIARDFNLKTGTLENTGFKIKSRVEENSTLFDMVQNALDLTLLNKGELYVMFDDFGKIALRNVSSMKLNLLIDAETGENFDYESSIDTDTYNKVKLVYDNEETGKREVYIAKDSKHQNQWGILQHFDTLQKGENGKTKANELLKLYNTKTKSLSVKNVFGDIRVRAGSMVVVKLNLGDMIVANLMLVEKCKHTFKESQHFMDLTLRGGEFSA